MTNPVLRRLRDLPSFKMAPDNPDVRGWTVRGSDGQPLGVVDELLVDPVGQTVRYLNVQLTPDLPGVPAPGSHADHHVLLPLAAVHLDAEASNVFVTALSQQNIRAYPLFVEFQLVPGFEEAMRQALV